MPDGQVVIVETKRLGGGSLLRETFVVAEPDPAKAVDLVKRAIGGTPDQTFTAVATIAASVIQAMELPQGCARLQSIS